MLKEVKWGEFRIGDLFEVTTSKGYDAGKLNFVDKSIDTFEFVGRTKSNYGIQGFVERLDTEPNNKETISVSQIGAVHAQFRANKWYSSQNIFVLTPKFKRLMNLLTVASIDKILSNYGGYSSYPTLKTLREHIIQLPILEDGSINFSFMEKFIAELEATHLAELDAYLSVTGLKDYELTEEEQQTLEKYIKEEVEFDKFEYQSIFNKIKQGRRLTKANQKPGNIPFVMSGITNTGVVNYISNPVASFPRNAITLDIFGNAFYRSYDFGAGDDTGVYWNDKKKYSEDMMLFLTVAMERSVLGQYSYGKKLRSSQSKKILMSLPSKNNDVDIETMELLIRAIKKLVIKDVVEFSNKRIETTKEIINK
ncbi:restriction endonuclease subunit S [Facklamia sp. P12950]|uniref:restriction endonuclease subunit S n=1 Tax=Facklamia sp. P12950 TaxID=3421951 RepID=UPI003D1828EA